MVSTNDYQGLPGILGGSNSATATRQMFIFRLYMAYLKFEELLTLKTNNDNESSTIIVVVVGSF